MNSASDIAVFGVRPLTESDVDTFVKSAGGAKAHPDVHQRRHPSADYLFWEAVIELKMLDDEGLAKPERQAKLASLFSRDETSRPVIVVDPERLPSERRREYDRILEGPIKAAVAKARKQLKRTRAEHPETSTAILLLVNNGYTALDHDELLKLVALRARNDTSEIDGVVVAGCYFYSDGFDFNFHWPIDYVQINRDRTFPSFGKLRDAWHEFIEDFMTAVVRGELFDAVPKGPVMDTEFEVGGVTFVKPAPPMPSPSDFYGKTRPRKNSSGLAVCPPVAVLFPEMSLDERRRFSEALPHETLLTNDEAWADYRRSSASRAQPLQPFVPVTVTYEGWRQWQMVSDLSPGMHSLYAYVDTLFDASVRAVLNDACERSSRVVLPARYVLVVTEEIGRDEANDLSTISVVREGATFGPATKALAAEQRAFHEHALALASAYAVAERIDIVLWEKDRRYAWT